jgi:Patatin-like phospholipase
MGNASPPRPTGQEGSRQVSMPTKYLAITIAGAVSLGSYEAGATYELLDAIRQHNDDAETHAKGDFIRIDVLTGASAGGMAAAILAQKLLYQKDVFVDSAGKSSPYDNPLYNTWVLGISAAGLLDTVDKPIAEGGDPASLSLLASSLIEQISKNTLAQQDSTGSIPLLGGMHNAIDLARGLRLGLALTNVNGVNYGYELFGGGEFRYTNFSDQMLRAFSVADRSFPPWSEVSEAAVACGAFLFAFRTKDLTRTRSDYEPSTTLDPWPGNAQSYPFTYTDGGVLQNQPLGMAKNLVDLNDNHLGNENRFYLFVSPSPMEGIQDLGLHEDDTNIIQVGKRLIDIYMGQSVFRDWIQAQNINEQIDLLDARATALAQALLANEIDAGGLAAASQQILTLLYSSSGDEETQAQAQARLARQYAIEVSTLGGADTATAQAFILAILALEKAADLGERDKMQIYGIVTQVGKLAGAGLAAFVGFLDQAFRQHDYDWGRTVAQQLLANPQFQGADQLGPIRYTPAPIRDIDQSLDGLQLKDVPKSDVKALKHGLTRRVSQIIGDAFSNPLERYPAQLGADLVLRALVDWAFSRNVRGVSGTESDVETQAEGEVRIGRLIVTISVPPQAQSTADVEALGIALEVELNALARATVSSRYLRSVQFKLEGVRQGSVVFDYAIYAAVVGTAAFVLKDYKQQRDGLKALLEDLGSMRRQALALVRTYWRDADIRALDVSLETPEQLEARLADATRIRLREPQKPS